MKKSEYKKLIKELKEAIDYALNDRPIPYSTEAETAWVEGKIDLADDLSNIIKRSNIEE